MRKETKKELRGRQARDAERQRKKMIEVRDVSCLLYTSRCV